MHEDTSSESTKAEPRRHRSKQLRRQIVEESLQPGTSVAVVARRHGVNANQVFQWRRLLQQGRLEPTSPQQQMLPVRVAESPVRANHGTIQITLGEMHISVEGAPDPETLRFILKQFSR